MIYKIDNTVMRMIEMIMIMEITINAMFTLRSNDDFVDTSDLR